MNIIKSGVAGLIVFIAVVIGFQSYTVVPVGEEASVSSFGEVKTGTVLKGFNWIPFWWSTDEYNLQNRTHTYSDLGVASKDKFKTYMDTSFTGAFLTNTADKIRKNVGNSDTYMTTHVNKRVLSCLTKAGGDVINSQAFFEKPIQVELADSTLDCVNTYLTDVGGYKLTSIQFSNIRLDSRVEKFMVETKRREEAEQQAISNLEIANTNAQVVVKRSKAELDAAANKKAARKLESEAALYAAQMEAQGNKELNSSISGKLVNYIKAQRWNGVMPTTMAGDNDLLIDAR